MKPLILNGIIYTEQYVRGLRQPLLAIRDCLTEGDKSRKSPYALAITETLAILQYYIEQVDK